MTLDGFIAKLRKTPREWRLSGRRIRRKRTGECPLAGVSGVHWAEAEGRLKLRGGVVSNIIGAADNFGGHDPKLRQRLLVACGLTKAAR